MTPEAPLEGSRMSHESLPLDEVARCVRRMVGNFKPEDVDRVPMRPTQGFEPLVSVVVGVLEIFCFQIPFTDLVEICVQDLSAVKETRPPLPEDQVAREARRLLATQQKEVKDAAKKRQIRKAQEQEALKKRRRQQSLDGLLLEESPSETVSGEKDDDSDKDDDALSRYDAVTGLADLPDVRPFLEPIGGSTSQASRLASVSIEVEEEPEEVGAGAGPSTGGAASSGAPQEGLMAPPPRAQAPRAQTAVGAVTSSSISGVPPMGVRTRGQLASVAQRAQGAQPTRAPRSARPAGGPTVWPSQAPSGVPGLPGPRPLVPLSG
jgi:hypothetical protein